VALSLGCLYLCAALFVAVLVPVARTGAAGAIALVVLPLGLVALHPAVTERVLALGRRVAGRELAVQPPTWRASVGLVLRYLPAWALVATATCCVAHALDPDAPIRKVALAAVLSWLVGFVVVPVPGGVGVREAAFVAAAGSLAPGVAPATAVVARLLFVSVDALGALALSPLSGPGPGPSSTAGAGASPPRPAGSPPAP
jgi:uncharacterized membrane protein YbhN (UPF0104 family)